MTEPRADDCGDGRHDFDFYFYFGHWRARTASSPDVRDADSGWLEFDSEIEAWPILGGLGNTDRYLTDDFPGRGLVRGYVAQALRPGDASVAHLVGLDDAPRLSRAARDRRLDQRVRPIRV